LQHDVSKQVVSTGVTAIDEMLGKGGVYRGSSILISGTAGTGKTSVCAAFLDAACRRGERGLMFAYEESAQQVVRNMRSIGIDLQPWIDEGLLHIHATRPSSHGLETHLVAVHKLVEEVKPAVLVIDPITNLVGAGSRAQVWSMLIRLVDFLKTRGITALYTSLNSGAAVEESDVGVSSLIDTWLLLRQVELGGERNRTLFVLKSRGMSHSNQVREFLLGDHGIDLQRAYLGAQGALTGSARLAQEARDREEEIRRSDESRRQAAQLAVRRRMLEAQMKAIEAELEVTMESADRESSEETGRRERVSANRRAMEHSKRVAVDEPRAKKNGRAHG
jgi:circadian clock protein KaiC